MSDVTQDAEYLRKRFEAREEALVPQLETTVPKVDVETLRSSSELARQRLELAAKFGTAADPEKETEIYRLQQETGLSEGTVRSATDKVKQLAALGTLDLRGIAARSPAVARWLENRQNSQLAIDDVANLSGIEWAIKAPIAAMRHGEETRQADLKEMGGTLMERLGLERTPERDDYFHREVLPRYYGEESFLERGFVQFAEQIPQIIGTLQWSAAAAGGVLAAGAAIPGDELITVPGAVLGAAYLHTAAVEAGSAHREFRQMRDKFGRPLDKDLAWAAANMVGLANGVFELLGAGAALRMAPGARAAARKAGIHGLGKALERTGFVNALRQFAKDYSIGVGGEVSTEMSQEMTTILAGVIAKELDAGTWDPNDWDANLARVWEIGTKTFEAMTVGGAFMGGPKLFADVREASRSAQNVARLEAMSNSARASKLRERLPTKFREIVEQMIKERGEATHVYIPVSAWNKAFEKYGASGADAAAEILGSTVQHGRALQAGQDADVVVPIASFLEKIAPADVYKDLVQDVRLYQEDYSLRELADQRKQMDEFLKSIDKDSLNPENFTPEQKVIYDTEFAKIKEAGRDNEEARGVATLHTHIMSRMAERVGKSPLDLYKRYTVRYQNVPRRKKGQTFTLEQRAFHGSPAKFDKFDLQYLGTGEGAQAFGWGFYFADTKQVAGQYTSFKNDDSTFAFRGETIDVTDGNSSFANEQRRILAEEFSELMPDESYEDLYDWFGGGEEELDDLFDDYYQAGVVSPPDTIEETTTYRFLLKGVEYKLGPGGKLTESLTSAAKQAAKKLVGILNELVPGEASEGYIYEVDIPPADELLDWEKPVGEQPFVMEKLRKAGFIKEADERLLKEAKRYEELVKEREKLQTRWGTITKLDQLQFEGVPLLSYLKENLGPEAAARVSEVIDLVAHPEIISVMREYIHSGSLRLDVGSKVKELDKWLKQNAEKIKVLPEGMTLREYTRQIYAIDDQLHEEYSRLARFSRKSSFPESASIGGSWFGWKGKTFYTELQKQISEDPSKYGFETKPSFNRADEEASRWLSSIGIVGHRYFDGFSRKKGEGTYNYVIYDPSRVTIRKRGDEDILREEFLEQRAFHGSPRQFSEFKRPEEVGFANDPGYFGFGLYFSDRRDVAKMYAPPNADAALYLWRGKFESSHEDKPDSMVQAVREAFGNDKLYDQFLEVGNVQEDDLLWEFAVKKLSLKKSTAYKASIEVGLSPEEAKNVASRIREVSKDYEKMSEEGHLYAVEVPEDDELANWDLEIKHHPKEMREKFGKVISGLAKRFPEKEFGDNLLPRPDETFGKYYSRLVGAIDGLDFEEGSFWGGSGPAAISELFFGAGIPGHRKTNVTMEMDPSKDIGTEFVIYDPKAVRIVEQLEQAKGKAPRGAIQFAPGGREFDISLFAKADRSTLLHELSHFYLELMGDLAEMAGPGELANDYKAALKFLGARERKTLTSKQKEKWARAFEQYLYEGKAPSAELVGLFQRMKAWMVGVYGRVKEIIGITPEIRGVFDRMIASETEMTSAEAQLGLAASAELQELMTPEEYARYQEALENAKVFGENELRAHLLEDSARELRDWFSQERKRVRDEVEKELMETKVYRALYFLQEGHVWGLEELPESLHDPTGKPWKLDRQEVIKEFGEAALRRLPKFTHADVGAAPYELAPLLGYDTAQELMDALKDAPSFEKAVRTQTEQRLKAIYGDLLEEKGRLASEAFAAAQNDKRVAQIMIELRVLRRNLKTKNARWAPFSVKALEEKAKELVAQQSQSELRPYGYQRNVVTHGDAAFRAMKAGSLDKAYDAKLTQLWNLILFRETRAALRKADRAIRFLRKHGERNTRKKFVLAGDSYLDALDGILTQYDLAPISNRRLERRQSLREWAAEMAEEGEEVQIDPRLLDEARRRNLREVPLEELLAAQDAVKNIAQLAKLKTKLLRNKDVREFAVEKERLLKQLGTLPEKELGPISPDSATWWDRVRLTFARWDARLLRREGVIDMIDGGDASGPASELIWNPIADAQKDKYDLQKGVVEELDKQLEDFPEVRKRLYDRVRSKLLNGDSFTRGEIIALASNWGSESNRARAVDGKPTKYGEAWNEAAVEELLGNLTREEWEFVQRRWDLLQSLWPRALEMQKRLSGVVPEEVPPSPFTRVLKDGTTIRLRGGYYPLVENVRDPGTPLRKLSKVEDVSKLFGPNYYFTTTPHGYLKRRKKGYIAPLLLDVNVLARHVEQVVHDVTHREAVLSVNRILRDQEIRVELVRRIGQEKASKLYTWLKHVANAETGVGDPYMEGLMAKFRFNATIAAMGYKVTVTAQNIQNFVNVMELVRPWRLAQGIVEYYVHPGYQRTLIHNLSTEMESRHHHLERDINYAVKRLHGKTGPISQVQRFAFSSIVLTDAFVAYPSWLAAYRQEFAASGSEERARRFADRVIRTTLSSGAPKDLAAIQTEGGEAMRMYTMFYSWFSTVYMRQRLLAHDMRMSARKGPTRFILDFPSFLARSMAHWIVPAILGEILASRGADDEDEWGYWAMVKVLAYPGYSVPVLREIAGGLEAFALGRTRDVKFGPLPAFGDEILKAGKLAAEFLEDEVDPKDAAKTANRLAGYILGLPSSQFEITGGYMYDVMSGEDEPEDVIEFIHNFLYRRPPEEKR